MARTSNERARERGHPGLRPAHARLMVYLDWSGSRITDIAKAADVSKNAIGQLVTDLEDLGYLERVPDPDDARAKIVRYTAAGRALIADARDIGAELDADVEAVIGPERMAQLKDILSELGSHLLGLDFPSAP
ncbi:MarR family transcriptional regulator [Mycobacterium sp. ACS4331]|nr:MarR family transcriptional regulator [Mycobacterium sp. ACS4331]